MKIDIAEKIKKHQKAKKLSLLLAGIFLGLTIISIVCFIIFANYRIQLLMSIVGSLVSSALFIVSTYFFVGGYLLNKYLHNFYKQLDNKEEQVLTGKFKNPNQTQTLKKGLLFFVVYFGDQECYLSDEKMMPDLLEGNDYQVTLKGNFVTEINK